MFRKIIKWLFRATLFRFKLRLYVIAGAIFSFSFFGSIEFGKFKVTFGESNISTTLGIVYLIFGVILVLWDWDDRNKKNMQKKLIYKMLNDPNVKSSIKKKLIEHL